LFLARASTAIVEDLSAAHVRILPRTAASGAQLHHEPVFASDGFSITRERLGLVAL
jgi:hypothetical protein